MDRHSCFPRGFGRHQPAQLGVIVRRSVQHELHLRECFRVKIKDALIQPHAGIGKNVAAVGNNGVLFCVSAIHAA